MTTLWGLWHYLSNCKYLKLLLVRHVLIVSRIDLPMKASSYLSETLHDPRTKGADNTAFNRALNTNMVYFSWLELPENAYRHKRFGASMKGVQNTTPPDSLLKGTSEVVTTVQALIYSQDSTGRFYLRSLLLLT